MELNTSMLRLTPLAEIRRKQELNWMQARALSVGDSLNTSPVLALQLLTLARSALPSTLGTDGKLFQRAWSVMGMQWPVTLQNESLRDHMIKIVDSSMQHMRHGMPWLDLN
jgi:hypothetical protein